MHSCGLGSLLVVCRYPKVGHSKLNKDISLRLVDILELVEKTT